MRFVGFDMDTIVGISFSLEFAKTEWVTGVEGGFYVVVDFLFSRLIFEFEYT